MVGAPEPPPRGHILAAWIVAAVSIATLGLVRSTTEAEFAFASAAIIPVLFVTWAGGIWHGQAAAVFAACMWVAADALSERAFSNEWVSLVNGITRLAVYSVMVYLVARTHELLRREATMARLDGLTGLMNRHAFFEAGDTEAKRARRHARPLAILYLDLDHFKQLNDSRGHEAGDRALCAVASALKNSLRATDSVARLGGDEFAVILPETSNKAAEEVVRKIAAMLESALREFPLVSVSIGGAWFESGGDDFATMLKASDELMYEAKQAGKGGVRLRTFPANHRPST